MIRELKVPVVNIFHDRLFTCESALGVDKVLRHILVSEIAFVRIAFFRLTALHRAFSHYLSAVEECSYLFVVELSG